MNVDRIIASLPEKTPAQRAIIRRNAEDKLKTGSDALKVASRKVLDALDRLEQSEAAAHQDWVNATPAANRVARAFREIPPSETEVRLLRVLIDNPASTSSDLTQKLGWKAQSWHLHFGKMCQAREAWLWPAEKFDKRDTSFFSGILADFDPDGSRFTMKPDVEAALIATGFGGSVRAKG